MRVLFADSRITDPGTEWTAEELEAHLSTAPNPLADLDDEALFAAFSHAHRLIAKPSHPLYESMRHLGLAFFLGFIRSDNLRRLKRRWLPEPLDDGPAERVLIRPRGTVGHWVAGNVPILGMLSTVMSLVAKNRTLVKMPSGTGTSAVDPVSPFLATLASDEMAEDAPAGRAIAAACTVLAFSRDEQAASRALADHCDARVVWGGRTAVDAVRALHSERRPDAETVAFGPRLSAAVVDPVLMSRDDWRGLATEIGLFDQLACTSPHGVFVKGGPDAIDVAARELADAFAWASQRGRLAPPGPYEAARVLEIRAELGLAGHRLIVPEGTLWTVDARDVLEPYRSYGYGVVSVQPWLDVRGVAGVLPENLQTVGYRLERADAEALTSSLVDTSVCRVVGIGHMHDFDLPWDGINLLDRLVRRIHLCGLPEDTP